MCPIAIAGTTYYTASGLCRLRAWSPQLNPHASLMKAGSILRPILWETKAQRIADTRSSPFTGLGCRESYSII